MHEGASFIRDPSTLTRYDPDAVRVALTLRHRDVEALEDALGAARSDIEHLQRELDVRAREIDQSTEAFTRTCDELRDNLEERTALLAETHRELEATAVQLYAQRVEIAGLRDGLGKRVNEIERWRIAVEDGARRLDEFHHSLSWRWTSPARAIYRLLRGR